MRTRYQILRALKACPLSFWQLVNLQDAHLVEFIEALKDLLDEGQISYQDGLFCLKAEVAYQPRREVICRRCGTGVELRGYFQELLEHFLEETKDRPLPVSDFDQGFVRPQDTVARLAYMYERGDIEDQEIFILGDDDLLSVAIGLTGMARRVTVVEVDERLTGFIREFASRRGLKNIAVREYNVLESLPDEEKGAYDTFVTDPVETNKGLFLFVGRCLETLKGPGAAGYMGFTHREASLKKWHRLETFVLKAGMVITDILRDFAIYPERENQWEEFYETYEIMRQLELPMPDCDWYKSAFVRMEAVAPLKIPEFDPPEDLKELYFDDESWATPYPSFMKEGD
ncbi:bis-aminopropyl spermidine synthase family protein [Thermosulfuriphilus sp.]